MAQTAEQLHQQIKNYLRATTYGHERTVASAELHITVLDMWARMRPHIQNTKYWEGDEENPFWRGRHPQTGEVEEIVGLKDLSQYVNRTELVHPDTEQRSASNGRGFADPVEKQILLPSDAAFEIGLLLDELFTEFGWGAEKRDGLPGEDEFDPTGEELERRKTEELME